jgi:hypothetical protein
MNIAKRLREDCKRMNAMFRSVIALLLVSCFATCGGADSKITLSILATDELGAVISDARGIIVEDASPGSVKKNRQDPAEICLKTDVAGMAQAELKSGFYDLFVSSRAFTPQARKIRLKSDPQSRSVFKLKADPLVSAEIGDVIYGNPK